MKLTRYITEGETISVASIMEYRKPYELKAAPGVIRIYALNATKGLRPCDAIVTPGLQQNVRIPKNVLTKAEFLPGQNVYVMKKDNAFFLLDPDYNGSAIKAVEMEPCPMPPFREPGVGFFEYAADAKYELAPMRKNYLFYRVFRDALDLQPDQNELVCSVFCDGAHSWLEVRKAPPDYYGVESIIPRIEMDERFRIPMLRELNGLTYRDTLKHKGLLIPGIFRRSYEIANTATLPVWYDTARNCIVIEGPIRACASCGKLIRTTSVHTPLKVYGCHTCLQELGPSGQISAIIQAEKALDEAAPFSEKVEPQTSKSKFKENLNYV